jgi:hypothetical protein
MRLTSPGQSIPADVYRCACGRFYIAQINLEYVDWGEGTGATNTFQFRECEIEPFDPMYISEVLPNGDLKLRCARQDHDFEKIVPPQRPNRTAAA